ncbi:MAG: SRPBCC domain-containing protein [Pseudomonadota bacterium]
MTDIRIEREFAVSPDRLFQALTQAEDTLAWFGPEGSRVTEGQTDFTKTGPWYMVLFTADGTRYKVSGQITHVTPPRSIGYTWGWHDDADARGPESFVTLTVETADKGAKLIIEHRGLGDDEIGASHTQGWNSSLASLATYLETAA